MAIAPEERELQSLRFDDYEVDRRTSELRKAGVKVKLSGQPLQLLIILLERHGEMVTREELQKRLWPDTFVDVDHNLNTAVNKIREVLGESAENPRFVETLPRRGYRFIAPVEGNGVGPSLAPPATTPPSGSRYLISRSLVLVSAIVLLTAVGVVIYEKLHNPARTPQRLLMRLTFDEGLQIGATWSPDSRFLAYSSNRGGKNSISGSSRSVAAILCR